MKERIRQAIIAAGAVAVGFAKAEPVDPSAMEEYAGWIGEGKHAGMDYLRRHEELKRDPSSVMEDVRTVISAAFSYAPAMLRDENLPVIATYAYGLDYHDVLRRRLAEVVETLRSELGGNWRICIDSAPLPERYWAMKSGIGRKGKNGSVIVDNFGSYIFLAEILTSHSVAPDAARGESCMNCGACVKACPGKALSEDGTIDARRCINYLTIEHRGEWTGEGLEVMNTAIGKRSLYGCDICQSVCPHNRGIPPTSIPEFQPSPEILGLTGKQVEEMDQAAFSRLFKGMAIKRAKLDGILRNARNLKT